MGDDYGMVIIDLCRTEVYRKILSLPDDGFNHLRTHKVTQKGDPDRSVALKKMKGRFVAQLMQRELSLYGDLS